MRDEVLRVSDQARPHALHGGAVAVMLMKHVLNKKETLSLRVDRDGGIFVAVLLGAGSAYFPLRVFEGTFVKLNGTNSQIEEIPRA